MCKRAIGLTNMQKRMILELRDINGNIRVRWKECKSMAELIDMGLVITVGNFYKLTKEGLHNANMLKRSSSCLLQASQNRSAQFK